MYRYRYSRIPLPKRPTSLMSRFRRMSEKFPVVVVGGGVVARGVVLVEVVEIRTGDAAACAGTTMDSTTGRVHRAGRLTAIPTPPTPRICRILRRLGPNSSRSGEFDMTTLPQL